MITRIKFFNIFFIGLAIFAVFSIFNFSPLIAEAGSCAIRPGGIYDLNPTCQAECGSQEDAGSCSGVWSTPEGSCECDWTDDVGGYIPPPTGPGGTYCAGGSMCNVDEYCENDWTFCPNGNHCVGAGSSGPNSCGPTPSRGGEPSTCSGLRTLESCVVDSCTDGIKNQNETGVDTGGICSPPNLYCNIIGFSATNDTPVYNTSVNLSYNIYNPNNDTWTITTTGSPKPSPDRGTNSVVGSSSTGNLTMDMTYELSCGAAIPKYVAVTPQQSNDRGTAIVRVTDGSTGLPLVADWALDATLDANDIEETSTGGTFYTPINDYRPFAYAVPGYDYPPAYNPPDDYIALEKDETITFNITFTPGQGGGLCTDSNANNEGQPLPCTFDANLIVPTVSMPLCVPTGQAINSYTGRINYSPTVNNDIIIFLNKSTDPAQWGFRKNAKGVWGDTEVPNGFWQTHPSPAPQTLTLIPGGIYRTFISNLGEDGPTKEWTVPQCSPATGYLDAGNCTSFSGWAWDPDYPNTATTIDIYKDGVLYAPNVPAGDFRTGLPGNGNHGFTYTTPLAWKDGNPYEISVYADDLTGDTGGQLVGSPKTITCTAPPGAMSGTLTPSATSCEILENQSSCTISSLSWTLLNPVATPTKMTASGMTDVTVTNTLATPQSGTVSDATVLTIPYPSKTFWLYNNAIPLDSETVSSYCELGVGLVWSESLDKCVKDVVGGSCDNDGIKEGDEECDDGDMIDNNGCSNSCTLPPGGGSCDNDGIHEPGNGEQCDRGEDNGKCWSDCDRQCRTKPNTCDPGLGCGKIDPFTCDPSSVNATNQTQTSASWKWECGTNKCVKPKSGAPIFIED